MIDMLYVKVCVSTNTSKVQENKNICQGKRCFGAEPTFFYNNNNSQPVLSGGGEECFIS